MTSPWNASATRTRAGAVLLGTALLLGLDCPHCDSAAPLDTAQAPPPCHETEAGPTAAAPPVAPQPGIECGCSSCELQLAVSSAPVGEQALLATPIARVVARPLAARVATRMTAGWIPPPYPGFSEQTVVSLN